MFASHNSLLFKYAPPVVHQPIEQGPGHGAVRIRGDLPSPEAGMCAQHKRRGFLTACDHAEQPRDLACWKTSGPTPRKRNATPKSLGSAYRPRTSAQAAERGKQTGFKTLGSVWPAQDERRRTHRCGRSTTETGERLSESAFRRNETTNKTVARAASRKNKTKN